MHTAPCSIHIINMIHCRGRSKGKDVAGCLYCDGDEVQKKLMTEIKSLYIFTKWLNNSSNISYSDDKSILLTSNCDGGLEFCFIITDNVLSAAITSSAQAALSDSNRRFLISQRQTEVLPLFSLQHEVVDLSCLRLFTLPVLTMATISPTIGEGCRIEVMEQDEAKQLLLIHITKFDPLLVAMGLQVPVVDASVVAVAYKSDHIGAIVCVTIHKQIYVHRTDIIDCSDFANLLSAAVWKWEAQRPVDPTSSCKDDPFLLVCNGRDEIMVRAVLTTGLVSHEPDQLCDEVGSFLCVNTLAIPTENRDASTSRCPDSIFLLLGQSNMSGRGRPRDVLEFSDPGGGGRVISSIDPLYADLFARTDLNSESDKEGHARRGLEPSVRLSDKHLSRVRYFDIATHMCDIASLHCAVDILKPAAVGPGPSFACRYLDRNEGEAVVGLLPGAVGATSSVEWLPGYVSPSRDHVAPPSFSTCTTNPGNCTPLGILPPKNATYQTGCANLFSCAMRTLFEGIRHAVRCSSPPGSGDGDSLDRLQFIRTLLRGALWYQGCNDATAEADAVGYGVRLEKILTAIRKYANAVSVLAHLTTTSTAVASQQMIDVYLQHIAETHPPLPIVIVAITSTRPWLTQIDVVRGFQQDAPRMCSLGAVRAVDAMGGMLGPDCIHLTAMAAVRLGQLLGDEMYALTNGGSFPSPPMATLLPTGADMFRSEYCNCESSDMACRSLTCLDCLLGQVYYSTRASAEKWLNEKHAASSVLGGSGRSLTKLSVLNSSLRGVNFVYGEISFFAIALLLREVVIRISQRMSSPGSSPRLKFVDLGCGTGVALAAAALSGDCVEVMGIDLMLSKLETCRCVMEMLESAVRDNGAGQACSPTHELRAGSCARMDKERPLRQWPSKIDIRHGNFLSDDGLSAEEWLAIDIVYVCSTCFAEDQMEPLYNKFSSSLSVGSHVILLDKQIRSDMLIDSSGACERADCAKFELILSCQCKTSWGHACAYVYRRYS